MRLPEVIPSNTLPQLLGVDEETGYLGNRDTYAIDTYAEYAGDKNTACWFPTDKVAKEWQSFVQGKPISNICPLHHTLPDHSMLLQNYPNPFNPITTIAYYLNKSDHVILRIYNPAGQEIATLVNGFQSQGEYMIQWASAELSSGIYYYRLHAGEYSITKKLIVQR